MKNIKWIFLLSALCVTLHAAASPFTSDDAGVGSVGNGGGLAEMKAYDLFFKIPSLTRICIQHKSCEDSLFSLLLLEPTQPLILNKSCIPPHFHLINNMVSMDSCQLYLSEGVPHNTDNIFKSVAIFKLLTTSSVSLESGTQIAETLKVFIRDVMTTESQSTIFWGYSRFKSLNFEKIFIENQLFATHVYIETQNKTFQIYEDLKAQLSCPLDLTMNDNIHLTNIEISEQSQNKVHFNGSVEYLCGSQKVNRKIYIRALLSQDETLTTHIDVFQ